MSNKGKIIGLATGLLLLVVLGVVASFVQAQVLIYNPPNRRDPLRESPEDYDLTYMNVEMASSDGYDLQGWYVPSQNGAAVIAQHGYKDDRTAMLPIAAMLARHGYGVLMIDLRAHGMSDGDLISFGLHEVRDVDAAYQYLLSQEGIDSERIGGLGVSLGGAVLLLHAAQKPGLKAVVADSSYATLQDEVAMAVAGTGLPAPLLAPLVQWFAEREAGFRAADVSPVQHIGEISPRAVFLIQGGMDGAAPSDSGQRLYDAAGEPRELWFEPDLGHAALSVERSEEYEERVTAFFDQYLPATDVEPDPSSRPGPGPNSSP